MTAVGGRDGREQKAVYDEKLDTRCAASGCSCGWTSTCRYAGRRTWRRGRRHADRRRAADDRRAAQRGGAGWCWSPISGARMVRACRSCRWRPVAERLRELTGAKVDARAGGGGRGGQGARRAAEGRRDAAAGERALRAGRDEQRPGVRPRAGGAGGRTTSNDAFGVAHRAHASTEGVAHLLPSAAGRLLEREVRTLTEILENPAVRWW